MRLDTQLGILDFLSTAKDDAWAAVQRLDEAHRVAASQWTYGQRRYWKNVHSGIKWLMARAHQIRPDAEKEPTT